MGVCTSRAVKRISHERVFFWSEGGKENCAMHLTAWPQGSSLRRHHSTDLGRSGLQTQIAGPAKEGAGPSPCSVGGSHCSTSPTHFRSLLPAQPHDRSRREVAAVLNLSPRQHDAESSQWDAHSHIRGQTTTPEVTALTARRSAGKGRKLHRGPLSSMSRNNSTEGPAGTKQRSNSSDNNRGNTTMICML